MTDQEINAAIAEACGWTEVGECENGGFRFRGFPPHRFEAHRKPIPNYCTDLNAMHEAEILIQDRNKYLNILASVTEPIDGLPKDHDWAFTRATARQRAEAFLKTLGKWEEAAK